jgi:hypothetical protein
MEIKLTNYDIIYGVIFFVINIIFLITDIGIFNKMNKYLAFLIILVISILYTIINRILYQLFN